MRPLVKTLAVLGLLLLAIPATVAQSANAGSIFGTPIRIGDADYVPVAKGASFLPGFFIADFGGGTDVHKLCVVMGAKALTSVANMPPGTAPFGAAATNAAFLTAGVPTARFSMRPDDLRVSEGCPGGPAGARFGPGQGSENVVPFVVLASYGSAAGAPVANTFNPTTTFQVVDMNNDGKYGAGEALYLVYNSDVTVPGALFNGLVPTAMGTFGVAAPTLKFTLRLTSQLGYAAGTFVMPGDRDFQQYSTGTGATTLGSITAAGTKPVGMNAVERDDKAVFLFPGAAAGVIPTGSAIPSGSVRMGPVGQTFIAPNIQATKITPLGETVTAGKPFSIMVDLLNSGNGGRIGLLLTKTESGQIIDARLSVPISAAGTDKMSWEVKIPCGGVQKLKVNEGFTILDVQGTPCATGTSTAAAAAGSAASTVELEQEIADLESRLEALESEGGVKTSGAQGAPSPAGVLVLGCLVAVALVLRRRVA